MKEIEEWKFGAIIGKFTLKFGIFGMNWEEKERNVKMV